MRRETVINLQGHERPDGTVYVTSPNLPLFHVLAPNREGAAEFAIKMLAEYFARNMGREVILRPADPVDSFFDGHEPLPAIPPHVIAEMAASPS